jgi:CRISPR-associated protein Cas2
MTVIVAEQTPPKVRGLLKRWFIEPKPNVFVGTVSRRTREKVLDYILKHGGDSLGLLVVSEDSSSQGFSIQSFRDTTRTFTRRSGHFLIAEKSPAPEEKSINSKEVPENTTPAGNLPEPEKKMSPESLALLNDALSAALVSYEPK